MSLAAYIAYENDWNTFNRIWSYNYTVRDLRAAGGSQSYYQLSDSERISYGNGEANHVSAYPIAGAAGAFNNIPSNTSPLFLCQYPFIKRRSDMSFDEYRVYKHDWNTFNRVWSYNYTVRDSRAAGGGQNYYQFLTDSERLSYRKGQDNHVSAYPTAALAGAFNNIP